MAPNVIFCNLIRSRVCEGCGVVSVYKRSR